MLVGFLTMLSLLPKHFRVSVVFLALFFAKTGLSHGAAEAMRGAAAVQSALVDFNRKAYDKALDDLAPALLADPQNAEALNLKGAILTKQQKYAEALACYNQALKSSPGFFPARYNIGALLALRQQWEEAIDYYRNLLIEQPNNELVEYKLLLLLLHQNADSELQAKLFATDLPTNTPAWYYAKASRLYKKGDPKEAAKYLEVARNVYGDKTDIFQQELDESGLTSSH